MGHIIHLVSNKKNCILQLGTTYTCKFGTNMFFTYYARKFLGTGPFNLPPAFVARVYLFLSFNYRNNYAISPTIFFFIPRIFLKTDIPRIFLEHECIFCG